MKCKMCINELTGLRTVFCSTECSHENDRRNLRCTQHVVNRNRADRRRRIADVWGRNGRHEWHTAESLAVDILTKEGFQGVKILSDYFMQSPFDACGMKDETMYVFQITTRTHTDKRVQHRLARDLRLVHQALFVSMKLGKYVLKNFSAGGLAELGEEEVRMARSSS